MILATMPPVIEYRQEFTREANTTVESAWAQVAPDSYGQGRWWKEIVFSRISKFERNPETEEFGTFNISEQVAQRLRSNLSKVTLQSLPLPTIVPLSGHGLSLAWATRTRAIELSVFADGDVTIDALEANNYVDLPDAGDLDAMLRWLILPAEGQPRHAAAR
jgi:hypothetical protein